MNNRRTLKMKTLKQNIQSISNIISKKCALKHKTIQTLRAYEPKVVSRRKLLTAALRKRC